MSMLFFADCVNKLTSVFCATITHARVCRGYLTFEHAPESPENASGHDRRGKSRADYYPAIGKEGLGVGLNNLYNLERR
jgi:hypothetical protein